MRFFFFFLLTPYLLIAQSIPRQVIGFWDSIDDKTPDDCLIHRTAEMPLNYLGFDVVYHDIQKPLPILSKEDGICGILLYLQVGAKAADPQSVIEWAIQAIDLGKKIIILRNPGFLNDLNNNPTADELQNRLFEKMGFTNTQKWVDYPFEYQVISADKEWTSFEKQLPRPLPGFFICKAYGEKARSYLKVGIPGKPESESDLLIVSPTGAYVAEYYANSFDNATFSSEPRSLGWFINPFKLFETVFDTDSLPKPDPTTLAGRRIFIGTCHGDSWNINTSIAEYAGKDVYCSAVLLQKVIIPNPDLPTAVAIVAADVDPEWNARKRSQDIARHYFALQQVESASHTYSHPFFWKFFEHGGPEKEINYLYLYPYGTWQSSFLSWLRAKSYQIFKPKEFEKERLNWGYTIPRAFANQPFELNKEISGAVNYLNQFAPPENQVKLLLWSGDSRPWYKPLLLCKQANIKNFGGGFVRFDPNYPSHLFVYPFARKVNKIVQLYSASNADNDYTRGWTDKFYGYQFLPATLKNTEIPRRLKPIHLYYHSYSGEFDESVQAILSNIAYIRTQSYIPIQVKRFCDIGEGFFTTVLETLGDNRWKVRNRMGLQTIRFDHADHKTVDFTNSQGIIGYTHHQNSLYVYLDAAFDQPIISIGEKDPSTSYLENSNWEVWNLKKDGSTFEFLTQGWGKLSMRWKMLSSGNYSFKALETKRTVTTDENGVLTIELDLPFNQEIRCTLEKIL